MTEQILVTLGNVFCTDEEIPKADTLHEWVVTWKGEWSVCERDVLKDGKITNAISLHCIN